jgi:hypothetical protein
MSLATPATIFEDYGNLAVASLNDNWGQVSILADSTEDYMNDSNVEYIAHWTKPEFLRLRDLGYI